VGANDGLDGRSLHVSHGVRGIRPRLRAAG
jgi:hypothetical protein